MYVVFPRRDAILSKKSFLNKQNMQLEIHPGAIHIDQMMKNVHIQFGTCQKLFQMFQNELDELDNVLMRGTLISKHEALLSSYNLSSCSFIPGDVCLFLPKSSLSVYLHDCNSSRIVDIRKVIKNRYEAFTFTTSDECRVHVLRKGWCYKPDIMGKEIDLSLEELDTMPGGFISNRQIILLDDNIPFNNELVKCIRRMDFPLREEFLSNVVEYQHFYRTLDKYDRVSTCNQILRPSDAVRSTFLMDLLALSEPSYIPVSSDIDKMYFNFDRSMRETYLSVFWEEHCMKSIMLSDVSLRIKRDTMNFVRNSSQVGTSLPKQHAHQRIGRHHRLPKFNRELPNTVSIKDWVLTQEYVYREKEHEEDEEIWMSFLEDDISPVHYMSDEDVDKSYFSTRKNSVRGQISWLSSNAPLKEKAYVRKSDIYDIQDLFQCRTSAVPIKKKKKAKKVSAESWLNENENINVQYRYELAKKVVKDIDLDAMAFDFAEVIPCFGAIGRNTVNVAKLVDWLDERSMEHFQLNYDIRNDSNERQGLCCLYGISRLQ